MRKCKSPFVLEHDLRANATRLLRGKTGICPAIQVWGSFFRIMLSPQSHPYRCHTSQPTDFPQIAAICPFFRAFRHPIVCHTDGAARVIMGFSGMFESCPGRLETRFDDGR
jgi:hypothetical protein